MMGLSEESFNTSLEKIQALEIEHYDDLLNHKALLLRGEDHYENALHKGAGYMKWNGIDVRRLLLDSPPGSDKDFQNMEEAIRLTKENNASRNMIALIKGVDTNLRCLNFPIIGRNI